MAYYVSIHGLHNKSSIEHKVAVKSHCYLCRDGCVKCSHLRCGSCLCTLSASNTSIPYLCLVAYAQARYTVVSFVSVSVCLPHEIVWLQSDCSILFMSQIAHEFWYSYTHPFQPSACSSVIVQFKSRADRPLCTVWSVLWWPERSLGTQHWNLSSWKWLRRSLVGEKYTW